MVSIPAVFGKLLGMVYYGLFIPGFPMVYHSKLHANIHRPSPLPLGAASQSEKWLVTISNRASTCQYYSTGLSLVTWLMNGSCSPLTEWDAVLC